MIGCVSDTHSTCSRAEMEHLGVVRNGVMHTFFLLSEFDVYQRRSFGVSRLGWRGDQDDQDDVLDAPFARRT